MIVVEFPMTRKDGSYIELKDVLYVVSLNCRSACAELKWSILFSDFTGKPLNPVLGVPEVENLALTSPEGYRVTWKELITFSEGVHQTISCWIVGVKPGVEINRKRLLAEDFSGCEIVIDVLAEDEWQLRFAEAGDD